MNSEGDTRHKGMKPTDWTFRVGLPASQAYQVLQALASGDVRRRLRGVREVEQLGDGRSAWFADPRGRPVKLSVAVNMSNKNQEVAIDWDKSPVA